jgi:hypothetical protein
MLIMGKYLKEDSKLDSLSEYRPVLVGLILSFLLHLLLILLPELLPQRMQLPGQFQVEVKPPKVTIRPATAQEIQRMRTVGIKNGAKNFSSRTSTAKIKGDVDRDGNGPRDFADLKVTKKDVSKIASVQKVNPSEALENDQPTQQKSKFKPTKLSEEGLIGMRQLNNSKPVRLSSPNISTLPVAPHDALLLNKTDFNLGFIPPEGVSEDQLNSIEKMFFSFQKRTYESYVNAFISSYYELTTRKPYLKNILRDGEHLMRGRIVFDAKGNIESLEVLNSSNDDNVHELFEETLTNIQSLPNPPKQLLNSQGQMIIYYQLNIKN